MENIADIKSVIRKIKKDEDINCIAFVISSWHYLNALATMELLLKSGRVRKGLILACRHQQAGFIVDEKLWGGNVDERIEKQVFHFNFLFSQREIKGYIKEKITDEKPFYILKPVEPMVGFAAELWNGGIRRNFIHIIIDEGLGFYLRSAKGWVNERKVIDSSITISSKDIIKKWQHQFYTTIMLRGKKQLVYNTFFIKRGKRLIVNSVCKKYLSKNIEIASTLYDYCGYRLYENSLVICTDTFHDLGQIANNADIIIIEQICNMAKKRNIKVVIKPHPREINIDKYLALGVDVDVNNLIPFEIIMAGIKSKPKAIIGITSTTLVTANILWGIDTISIVNVIGRENFKKEAMEDIDNFPKLFSRYVKIPMWISDVFEYI